MTILLAVTVAERTGMLGAAIRVSLGSAPRWLLPYAVGLVGVTASVMADAAFIVVPPLAAMVFKAAGRHPIAGLVGGFAAVGAGYSTSLVVTSLDALFAGITNAVTDGLPTRGHRHAGLELLLQRRRVARARGRGRVRHRQDRGAAAARQDAPRDMVESDARSTAARQSRGARRRGRRSLALAPPPATSRPSSTPPSAGACGWQASPSSSCPR